MDFGNKYYSSQLEAIQDYYHHLMEEDGKEISLTEAIINWFTEGHAEAFREEYLRSNNEVALS
ncbi:MAG TPA: hypothetical protein PKV71_00170 [Calditrichia bacterium]|nr:hypothetical protein [Calditrichota bacterium]HQV30253.1 hypothetical protein [Calditrichia bacterium]